MNHSKSAALKQTRSRRLSLMGFARVASLLSLGALIVIVPYIIFSGDPWIWIVSAALCGVTIALIWTVTISVGCLVMIPVAMWRLSRRLDRGLSLGAAQNGQVWDRWIDGPKPSLR
jgi:VIT1/CCC1 family predicted Fe2+/Mn2+ transporter